mgnify:CR=1 FL=1
MRKKLLSVALCATMVAGLLAGCGSSSKSDKASSDSKGSVYWWSFTGNCKDIRKRKWSKSKSSYSSFRKLQFNIDIWDG